MDNTRTQLIDMKRQLTPHDLTEAELKAAFTKRPAEVKKFKGRLARLKGMLTQWAPFHQQIENYTARKVKESKQLPEKIARLRKVIKDQCAHPVEYLEVTSEYFADQFKTTYDPASGAHTDYYVKCTLCNKKEKVRTVDHDTYGK